MVKIDIDIIHRVLSGMIINLQYLNTFFLNFRNKLISEIFTKMQSQAYGLCHLLTLLLHLVDVSS